MPRLLLAAAPALVLALVATGCSSLISGAGGSGGTDPAAERAAYHCPSAARMTVALGKPVSSVKRSTFKDRSLFCDYQGASAGAIVGITFGSAPADLEAAVALLPGNKNKVKLPVGDEAYLLTDDGTGQLEARFGDRIVSVTGVPGVTNDRLISAAKLVAAG